MIVSGSPTLFFMSDFENQRIVSNQATFSKRRVPEDEWQPNVVAVSYYGTFEEHDGIWSGTITSIKGSSGSTKGPFDIYIDDLVAFVKSGTIGVQLLMAGDDVVRGYSNGYGGDDVLITNDFGPDSGEFFDGGGGWDTLSFEASTSALKLDFINDQVPIRSIEAFRGTRFDDEFRGTGGNDDIDGHDGNDYLVGRGGKDVLDGGSGNDRLVGQSGADQLTGGPGKDTFIYDKVLDSPWTASDKIMDFSRADDIIDLKNVDASTEKPGNQTFIWMGTASYKGKPGELNYFFQHGDTVIRSDIDGDKSSDFKIRLEGEIKLTSLDFIL